MLILCCSPEPIVVTHQCIYYYGTSGPDAQNNNNNNRNNKILWARRNISTTFLFLPHSLSHSFSHSSCMSPVSAHLFVYFRTTARTCHREYTSYHPRHLCHHQLPRTFCTCNNVTYIILGRWSITVNGDVIQPWSGWCCSVCISYKK